MPTPGVLFILRGLANLLLPAVGAYGSFYVLGVFGGVHVPWVVKWITILTSSPVSIVARGIRDIRRIKREAQAIGAARVPIVRGKKIGNIDILQEFVEIFRSGYPAEQFWPIVEIYGDIYNIRVLWTDQLFTTEPDHIKQILASEFSNFEKGEPFITGCKSVLGTGVFNSDGDMWKFHRMMTRPFFSKDRISHFDIFERHSDEAIALATRRLHEGHAIDIQDLFSRFTLDSATDFLFGNCVYSLHAGLPYPDSVLKSNPEAARKKIGKMSVRERIAEEFTGAFADAQMSIAERLRMGIIWPLSEIRQDQTKRHMEIVNAFLDPILAEALRKKQERKNLVDTHPEIPDAQEIEEDETLLDHLVRFTDDKALLKDEILNIMIAGRDTTAATLTFTVYLLCLYPEVTRRLRTEILEKVGPVRRPTYDDIREMKFLRAVLNETLRLYPVVPFNVRQSINATTFSSPTGKPWYIPPKTSVGYSVFMMHRRTDLWGPDAMEFDPDRFLDERLQKYLTPNPFIFLPFNAGPRICLGQQFAYNEASFMLIRLLQNFDSFQLDMSAQPADSRAPSKWRNALGRQSTEVLFPKCHLTMYLHKGLWVQMHEAGN